MRNKSGFLLAEETLRIVIALIVIILLVSFLTSLYFINSNRQETVQEEQTLIDQDESLAIEDSETETVESETGVFVAINNFLRNGWGKIRSLIGPKFTGDEPTSVLGVKGQKIPGEEIIGDVRA